MRKLFILLFSASFLSARGQEKNASDSASKIAPVDVLVTSMKGQPRKGEQILFRGEKTGKLITGISPASGKFRVQLPPGDTYVVSVKSITDTTKYTKIVIPELAEDEFFTEPYWVNIKFDPARSYRLDNVHFDTDKASLRPDSYTQLKELLEYLQRHEEITVEIAGHTDNVGTDAHNLKLSQDRSNTIRTYLVGKGIKASRITAKGYGAGQPVADNNTDAGRQQNRRTELRIL
jgi:outer membrane protein OmpA-like peptidoglycan-associated protein